jgi:hypothetical protein
MINSSKPFVARLVNKFSIYIVFFSLFFLLFSSCTCSKCSKVEISTIPANVLKASDDFIISKVGKKYFQDHFVADLTNSQKKKTFFEMHYRFVDRNNEEINEDVFFFVDTNARIIKSMEIKGVPDCLENPELCEIKITKEEAIQIAEIDKLQEGIKDWKIKLRWLSEEGSYVWHILATYSEMGSGDSYKAKGEEIFINPNSGSVIKKREWAIR